MARWPTSAALALVVLLAGCGYGGDAPSKSVTTKPAAHAQLAPVGQQPLTVRGTGFQPHEKVVLAAKGLKSARATATADASGSFTASFRGLEHCDSVTVTAIGSKGSRAEFNLSQIACVDR